MRPPVPHLSAHPQSGSTPGLALLWQAALRCALWLAGLGAAVGLVWRWTGSAPDLALALDGAGLALWLCAWPLAEALSGVRARMERHTVSPLALLRGRIVAGAHLWAACLVLALSTSGVLLGYQGGERLLLLETLDPFTIPLLSGWFSLAVLLALGPPAAMLAAVLLLWLKRLLGAWGGLYAWAACALLAHLPLLTAPGIALATRKALSLAPLGLNWQASLPHQPPLAAAPLGLSLGQYANDLLQFFSQTTLDIGRYAYLETQLQRTAIFPGLVLLAALLGWLGYSALPPRNSPWRWQPSWAAAISLLAAGLGQGARTANWLGQPELRFPSPVATVFTAGIAALWLVHAAGYRFDPRRLRLAWADALWTVVAAAGWLALTMPQLASGQTALQDALVLAAAALAIALAGQAVITRVAMLAPAGTGAWLGFAMALALLIPLGTSGSLAAWLLAFTTGAGAGFEPATFAAVLGLLALLALICWPWPLRRKPGPQRV